MRKAVCLECKQTQTAACRLSGPPKSQKEQASPKPAADKTPPGAMRLPWYVGKERGTKLSQSAVLSDREMEMIELGGAPP